MARGDRLEVTQGEYAGFVGEMVGVTREGLITVCFGDRWTADFDPHHLELAPVTLWNLLVASGQWGIDLPDEPEWPRSTTGFSCETCGKWFPGRTAEDVRYHVCVPRRAA